MNFTNEQMTRAKSAKSAEELLEMAKAEGIAMTEEQAAKYFAELHTEGELSDDELTSVAGGKEETEEEEPQKDPEEYNVEAGWSACDQYSYVPVRVFSCPDVPVCGKCKHFNHNSSGKIDANTPGKCRREFD